MYMKRLRQREGKGFEVQWYDVNGDNDEVVQVDTVKELAQYLARCCWGTGGFVRTPTIWKDGKHWCHGQFDD